MVDFLPLLIAVTEVQVVNSDVHACGRDRVVVGLRFFDLELELFEMVQWEGLGVERVGVEQAQSLLDVCIQCHCFHQFCVERYHSSEAHRHVHGICR